MASKNKFDLPERYKGEEENVWEIYLKLSHDYKPCDLGQGCPDYAAPPHLVNALAQVAKSDSISLHQSTRTKGHPRLVKVLSKLYSGLLKMEIDPFANILVTSGAYGSLYSSISGHVDVGDEVIIIEPYFDCYESMVKTAGGIPKYVPLRLKTTTEIPRASDWVLDADELKNAFNSKTKAIIINTPHNPIGKVFNEEELTEIAELCKKWNVLCISDEVYEWQVFQPNKHVRIASLPGMWERTITIGSAGKTFSITGWKTGWAYGPANLLRNLEVVHRHTIFDCSTPIQEAIAIGFEDVIERLGKEDCYFISMAREIENKRNFMAKFLTDVGMKPMLPEGGYFMLADWSPLESRIDLSAENDNQKDYRFTKWLTKTIGVQGIPPTAFYSAEHKKLAENFVRFCFIKKQEKLNNAAQILQKLKSLDKSKN